MGLSSQYSILLWGQFLWNKNKNQQSICKQQKGEHAVYASSHFKLRSVPSGKLTKLKRALQNEGMAQQNSDVIK